jgi:outer membrane protein
VSSSPYQAKAADENAVATKQQIILAVDQAFYNTLETNALFAGTEDTVKARQVLVDQVQALTSAKLKSDVDLSVAKVDLGRAQPLQLDTQANYEASLSVLSAILGYSARQNFVPVEASAQVVPPVADLASLIQQALDLRPEVRALRDEVLAAKKFSRSEHDLWRPTVSALGVVGEVPVRNVNVPSWYGGGGVNVNIPVSNGFFFNARAKSADLGTQVKQKQLEDLQDNVARDVRNSWLGAAKACQRLRSPNSFAKKPHCRWNSPKKDYRIGLGTIVEFSRAELQKTDADIQDTDARYQYRLSQILLAYEIGLSR